MIENNEITFCYSVGGASKYYEMLEKSINSLQKCRLPYRVLVLDASGHYKSSNPKVKVVDFPLEVDPTQKGSHPYNVPMVSMRYNAYKYVETDVAVYADVDTVFVSSAYLEKIIPSTTKFIIAQHWWVPTLSQYFRKNVIDYPVVKKILNNLKIDLDRPYIASGVFIFRPALHKKIFENFQNVYDMAYKKHEIYKDGLADETILTLSLNFEDVFLANGALNHCVMGDDCMPLIIKEDKLLGKNSFDILYEEVVFMHCDESRRNPLEPYSGHLREKIEKVWNLSGGTAI
jgi:hypothetical protein